MQQQHLVAAIKEATRLAYHDLLRIHAGHYYYFSLITTGEAHPPVIAAWSEESLESAVKDATDKEDARWGLKWSYADSPFYCFGEHCFTEVRRMFSERPVMTELNDTCWKEEFRFRVDAMEKALQELDLEELFGTGSIRNTIVVNVEVVPPDHTNTLRAIRLNPPRAIEQWLLEAAEHED